TRAVVQEVRAWAPDQVVLLPLYPQYSTTTTASSLAVWGREAALAGVSVPTVTIRSYPTAPGLVAALAGQARRKLSKAAEGGRRVRLLMSAHGLPLKIVHAGDPYPREIESTARAVANALAIPGLDWRVCYQ